MLSFRMNLAAANAAAQDEKRADRGGAGQQNRCNNSYY